MSMVKWTIERENYEASQRSLFEKLRDGAATAQDDVPEHIVAGEYNSMITRVIR